MAKAREMECLREQTHSAIHTSVNPNKQTSPALQLIHWKMEPKRSKRIAKRKENSGGDTDPPGDGKNEATPVKKSPVKKKSPGKKKGPVSKKSKVQKTREEKADDDDEDYDDDVNEGEEEDGDNGGKEEKYKPGADAKRSEYVLC